MRPPANSVTAAAVRAASENPKAARRSGTAAPDIIAGAGRPITGGGGGRRRRPRGGGGRRDARGWRAPALAPAQHLVEALGGRGRGVVPEAHHEGDAAPGGGVDRHGVGLLLLDELQAVLEGAQEAVRVGQGHGVLGRHVPRRPQLPQGAQGGAVADAGVGAAVHELQELHRELDVADPARAALDLASGHALLGHDALGAGLHGPHRTELIGAEGPAPHLLGGGRLEGPSQGGVAGHGAGLEERLELPGGGPSPPVGPVAGERARQRPGPALGTEIGVDAEGGAGHLQHAPGGRVARLDVGDEHHVDVAGVVELAAAELAHPDDAHAGGVGDGQGAAQHPLGQLGQGPPDVLQGVEAEEVAGRDAQKLETLRRGPAWRRQGRRGPRDGPGRRGPRGHRGRGRTAGPARWRPPSPSPRRRRACPALPGRDARRCRVARLRGAPGWRAPCRARRSAWPARPGRPGCSWARPRRHRSLPCR